MKTPIVSAVTIACVALAAHAQETIGTPQDGLPSGQTEQHTQEFSASLVQNLPLDAVAEAYPGALDGIAVLDSSEKQIGTVTGIARNKSDQSLHAIIDLVAGADAALPLGELSVAALVYNDPEPSSVSAYVYDETRFEQVSGYQGDYAAEDGSANPAEVVALPLPSPEDNPGNVAREMLLPHRLSPRDAPADNAPAAQPGVQPEETASATQQTSNPRQLETDPTQLPSPTQAANAAASASGTAAVTPIPQIAMIYPEALQGKPVIDRTGEPLGEVFHIARSISDEMLYAVINVNTTHHRSAVRLEALGIGSLGYAGADTTLQNHAYDEADFVPVEGP